MLAGGDEGHIVNTASMAGLITGRAGNAVYDSSKHACLAITESLYRDLVIRTNKVSASVLCPGAVMTNIFAAERNRPAELGDAHDECVLKQPARVQILNQSRRRLIVTARHSRVISTQVPVRVPVATTGTVPAHHVPPAPKPAPTPAPAPSPAIETLQRELGRLNYYEGPITGTMNTQTVQAITYLQRDAHLPQTGTMNAATQQALVTMLAQGNNQMGS